MNDTYVTPTGRWKRVGVTFGLSRYAAGEIGALQTEQVYLDRCISPTEFPHPDGGKLEPRVYKIRQGRGYSIRPVMELTRQQAIELAKLILEDVGDEAWMSTPHPGRKWDATTIRASAKTMARRLEEIATAMEAL